MVDLSVLSTFDPVSLSATKNSSGDGISFESDLDPYIKSKDADELAKIIQKEAKKSKSDEAEKLKIIERSLAYVRAKGGSDLSSDVYDLLKDKDSNEFIDVFGQADKVPDIVNKNESAKTAWAQIQSGAAYDHIEEYKTSIEKDLKSARSEADGDKTLKITDNRGLIELKDQLEENMSSEAADKDISKMLREAKLLGKDESVQITTESSSSTSSKGTTKKLEALRKELTERVNTADTPEEARRILERAVPKFEALRPSDDDEPELFYTKQMQKVLDKSENDVVKGYTVAANPSLNKIETDDGEELIMTSNKKVFVNPDGAFVDSEGKPYNVTDDKIKVDGKKIDVEDIKSSSPEISVFMDKDEKKVQDKAIEASKKYVEDQRLVHEARGDKIALKELDKVEDRLEETKYALKERRKKEKEEGTSGSNNNTLQGIVGILTALATVVAALSQGSGKTTCITGGSGYNRQYGYGYGSYASDKYGYNRGYQATVNAAYQRSEQYLSTFRDNLVGTRASIMRKRGMAAIQGQDGGFGVYNT
jgi:hypothetical protein